MLMVSFLLNTDAFVDEVISSSGISKMPICCITFTLIHIFDFNKSGIIIFHWCWVKNYLLSCSFIFCWLVYFLEMEISIFHQSKQVTFVILKVGGGIHFLSLAIDNICCPKSWWESTYRTTKTYHVVVYNNREYWDSRKKLLFKPIMHFWDKTSIL